MQIESKTWKSTNSKVALEKSLDLCGTNSIVHAHARWSLFCQPAVACPKWFRRSTWRRDTSIFRGEVFLARARARARAREREWEREWEREFC